jgi:1-acyl-sn-glycerol-3-phosphate acyltransferase
MIDAIFLDREKPRDALNMVHDCNKYLNESRNVVIFPEGTRSKDKDVTIHTYKPGAFKCAYKTGAKIVPIVIDKSYLPLSVKRKNTDKIVKVRILDPINPSEYENISTNELALMVENKAKSELEVLRNEDK